MRGRPPTRTGSGPAEQDESGSEAGSWHWKRHQTQVHRRFAYSFLLTSQHVLKAAAPPFSFLSQPGLFLEGSPTRGHTRCSGILTLRSILFGACKAFVNVSISCYYLKVKKTVPSNSERPNFLEKKKKIRSDYLGGLRPSRPPHLFSLPALLGRRSALGVLPHVKRSGQK